MTDPPNLVWKQMKKPRFKSVKWEIVYLYLAEDGGGIPLGYVDDICEEFPYVYEVVIDPEEFYSNPHIDVFFAETVKEAMDAVEKMVDENGCEWAEEALAR